MQRLGFKLFLSITVEGKTAFEKFVSNVNKGNVVNVLAYAQSFSYTSFKRYMGLNSNCTGYGQAGIILNRFQFLVKDHISLIIKDIAIIKLGSDESFIC